MKERLVEAGVAVSRGPNRFGWYFLLNGDAPLLQVTSYAELAALAVRVFKLLYVEFDPYTFKRPTPIYVYRSVQQMIQYLRFHGRRWVDASHWSDEPAFDWLYEAVGEYNRGLSGARVDAQLLIGGHMVAQRNAQLIDAVLAFPYNWKEFHAFAQLQRVGSVATRPPPTSEHRDACLQAIALVQLVTGMRVGEVLTSQCSLSNRTLVYARLKMHSETVVEIREFVGQPPGLDISVMAARVFTMIKDIRAISTAVWTHTDTVRARVSDWLSSHSFTTDRVSTHILRKLYVAILMHKHGYHRRSIYEQIAFAQRWLHHATPKSTSNYLSSEAGLDPRFALTSFAKAFL